MADGTAKFAPSRASERVEKGKRILIIWGDLDQPASEAESRLRISDVTRHGRERGGPRHPGAAPAGVGPDRERTGPCPYFISIVTLTFRSRITTIKSRRMAPAVEKRSGEFMGANSASQCY